MALFGTHYQVGLQLNAFLLAWNIYNHQAGSKKKKSSHTITIQRMIMMITLTIIIIMIIIIIMKADI